MSDITCDYCGDANGHPSRMFMRGHKPDGDTVWACQSCMTKIMREDILANPAFIDTPLGQTPIDQQRP